MLHCCFNWYVLIIPIKRVAYKFNKLIWSISTHWLIIQKLCGVLLLIAWRQLKHWTTNYMSKKLGHRPLFQQKQTMAMWASRDPIKMPHKARAIANLLKPYGHWRFIIYLGTCIALLALDFINVFQHNVIRLRCQVVFICVFYIWEC